MFVLVFVLVVAPVVAPVVVLVVVLVVAPVVQLVCVLGWERENQQVGGLQTLDYCISIGSACRAISSSGYGWLCACAPILS